MRICDICKDLKKSTFEVRLVVVKAEEKKGKIMDREVISILIDLCDKDITTLNFQLGKFVQELRNVHVEEESGQRDLSGETHDSTIAGDQRRDSESEG